MHLNAADHSNSEPVTLPAVRGAQGEHAATARSEEHAGGTNTLAWYKQRNA